MLPASVSLRHLSPAPPEAPLRWDAPLLATLARSLGERLADARLRAVLPDFEARRFTAYFRELTLLIRLHPREAGVFVLDAAEPPDGARPLAARLRAVTAPADERVVVFSLLRVRGRPAEVDLVVEWITNRHNLVLTEGPERTVRLAFDTRDGDRTIRQGRPYTLPPPASREGVDAPVSPERWREVVEGDGSARDLRRALTSTFAWTSPLNAPALLAADPDDGWHLWSELGRVARGERPATPVVLETPRGLQPYPLPLPGLVHRPTPDLLAAVALAADVDEAAPAPTLLPARLLERLERRVDALRVRVARLEEQLAGLGDADRLQEHGDLILARFREIPRGEASVQLTGFDGSSVDLELDPTLAPDANARIYYDEAARIRRARERLPALIADARAAWETAGALLERARAGGAPVDEVEAAVPDEVAGGDDDAPTLPYRRYRSSGGLEIRVGRGAKRNDDLTFRHSAPDDIWLHARDTAGAHVILRWGHEDNPPARDLAEAAILAALGSKARTSGSVPVDWTRRKYVRKPRKSPPGAVVPDRVKTVFVEPDPAVEARLRTE